MKGFIDSSFGSTIISITIFIILSAGPILIILKKKKKYAAIIGFCLLLTIPKYIWCSVDIYLLVAELLVGSFTIVALISLFYGLHAHIKRNFDIRNFDKAIIISSISVISIDLLYGLSLFITFGLWCSFHPEFYW